MHTMHMKRDGPKSLHSTALGGINRLRVSGNDREQFVLLYLKEHCTTNTNVLPS